ncbi:MAG TPA: hypothetical protein VFG35_08015 [Actinoplanes sp.]|nr:hypothetical protein [Actinoplanes sp.]
MVACLRRRPASTFPIGRTRARSSGADGFELEYTQPLSAATVASSQAKQWRYVSTPAPADKTKVQIWTCNNSTAQRSI